MKYLLILFLFFTSYYDFQAQQLIVIVNRNNSNNATLSFLEGEKIFFIDSIKSSDKKTFSFFFNKAKYNPGVYRLTLDQSRWIDFIYDDENVNIETDGYDIIDSINVHLSESNQYFYAFIKLNNAYKTKTELLNLILSRYPKDDDFYNKTHNKISQLQNEYLKFIKEVSKKKHGSFVGKYIQNSQLPVTSNTFSAEEQLQFLKSHALDNVNFCDGSLIYSDVFTNKTIEYLTYYRNPQLPKELLEKEFMKAVDTILNKAKVHQLVYQQIVEYLIDGFKKFGFDTVLDYIVENYIIKDDICLDVKTEGLIKKRINQAKFLHVGKVIPNIILPDIKGELIELKKINADRVLVIFYSSWCSHCMKLLPQIREEYLKLKKKGFEILAVSLDSSKTDWLNFIKNNSLDWLNVSDLKGWDSKAISDYHIYATPTIFLVDKERKIIGKPLTIDELYKIL